MEWLGLLLDATDLAKLALLLNPLYKPKYHILELVRVYLATLKKVDRIRVFCLP